MAHNKYCKKHNDRRNVYLPSFVFCTTLSTETQSIMFVKCAMRINLAAILHVKIV